MKLWKEREKHTQKKYVNRPFPPDFIDCNQAVVSDQPSYMAVHDDQLVMALLMAK